MKTKIFALLGVVLLLWGCEKKPQTIFPEFEGKLLQIWTTGDGGFMDALGREFVATLGTENTTMKVVSFENQKELENTLLDALAEGAGPDVIFSDSDWIVQNPTKIIPLSGDESLTPEKFRRIFIPAAESLIRNQSLLAIPLHIDTLGILYNKEYFEQYLDQTDPPSDWGSFHQVVRSLTKQDNSLNRFSLSGAAIGRVDNIIHGIEIFENLLTQTIGELFDTEKNPQFSQKTGVTPEGKRIDYSLDVLNYFLSFADPTHPNFSWNTLLAKENSSDKDFLSFIKGETALIFGTLRDFQYIQSLITTLREEGETTISPHNIGIAPFPQFETKGAGEALVGKLQVLAVPISSREPTLAWKFLKFAMREENLRGYADVTQTISAHNEILLEQQSDPAKGIFAKQSVVAHVPKYPFAREEVLQSFAQLINDTQQGKVTPSTGLARLAEQFSQKLQRRKTLFQHLNSTP